MTPIQEKAIIPARRGVDILACAQTGTGKTADSDSSADDG